MKVALVFSGCHKRGGVERSVWEAAHEWQDEHQVTVIAEQIDHTGLPRVETREMSPSRSIREFSRKAAQAYDVDEFDDVISFGVQPLPATVLWVNSVHRAWIRASLAFPAGEGLKRFPWLRYLSPYHLELLRMERAYFRRGSFRTVIVVADHVGYDLQRLYGVDPSLLHTVHNGFDPKEFSPAADPRVRAEVRSQLDVPADAYVCLTVANELQRKGVDILVRAVSDLGDPRVHVLLVGKADPSPLTGLIRRLGLTDRVHWAGSRDDVGRLHAASDCFVLPTQYEAFCLAVVEALGSGLPVIVTQVPGAGDLIEDGVNGLLLRDPRDHVELAGLIRAQLRGGQRASPADLSSLHWSSLMASAMRHLESGA